MEVAETIGLSRDSPRRDYQRITEVAMRSQDEGIWYRKHWEENKVPRESIDIETHLD